MTQGTVVGHSGFFFSLTLYVYPCFIALFHRSESNITGCDRKISLCVCLSEVKRKRKNRILGILSGLVRVLSELFNQKCWPRYLESGMIPSIMQGAIHPQLVDDRREGGGERERIQLNLVVSFKEE